MPLEPHDHQERLAPGHRHALPDAHRADARQLQHEIDAVASSPVIAALVEAVDASLLVLNARRQVVAFNGPERDRDRIAGLRTGEVLACVNASAPGGCGTTASCERCGALGAILGCERSGRAVVAECVISAEVGGTAIELEVRATPVKLAGGRFTVVTLRDVSAAKRREALEQIFFHDLLNTVSGVRGWASQLVRPGTDVQRAGERLDVLSRQLEREIRDQRALVLAEAGTLVAEPTPVHATELVEEVRALFAQHASGRDRAIEVAVPADLCFETDHGLVARVLINMMRNALEATPPCGTVRLVCAADAPRAGDDAGVTFSVSNAAFIPPEIQARVFQRSFSTKGRGRGLGTYGMRLLAERYLRGKVSFVSSPEDGTTFTLVLPPTLAPRARPA
ncbi:MAG TPA: HAMP domain-containing sensor histidine kinase [Anaeromyxobacter sp.]